MSAETPLVLGVRTLARLACVPRSRVNAAMDAGTLVTVVTEGLRGRPCRYALLDGDGQADLDRWVRLHIGSVLLDDVELPRTNGGRAWFRAGDVHRAGLVDDRGRVRDVGAFLRWAASLMPRGERAAILGALVEDEPCEASA